MNRGRRGWVRKEGDFRACMHKERRQSFKVGLERPSGDAFFLYGEELGESDVGWSGVGRELKLILWTLERQRR